MGLYTITDELGHVEIGRHGGGGGRGGRGFGGRRFGGRGWGPAYYDDYYDPWAAPVFIYKNELPPGIQIVRGEEDYE